MRSDVTHILGLPFGTYYFTSQSKGTDFYSRAKLRPRPDSGQTTRALAVMLRLNSWRGGSEHVPSPDPLLHQLRGNLDEGLANITRGRADVSVCR